MSKSESGGHGYADRSLAEAKRAMDHAVNRYQGLLQRNAAESQLGEAHTELHISVMNVWHLTRPALKDMDPFWTGNRFEAQVNGQRLAGLRSLAHYQLSSQMQERSLRPSGRGKTTRQRTATKLPPRVLIGAANTLNDAIHEMGHGISTPESTPRTELTDEMIEEVEEWRQQNLVSN